jgi:hypothetical protein
MNVLHLAMTALLVAAPLACKLPDGPSKDKPEDDKEEQAGPATGSLTDVSLSDLEKRAKGAGWKVDRSGSHKDFGIEHFELDLDNGKYFAYVRLIDFAPPSKKIATKVGDQAAVVVELVDGGEGKVEAKDVLEKLLAKVPLEKASRDSVKKGLEGLGLKVTRTDSSEEDGIVTTQIDCDDDAADAAINVQIYDFSAAKKKGHLVLDGERLLNAAVCKDCTTRSKGLGEAWQTSKAKGLVTKLAKK